MKTTDELIEKTANPILIKDGSNFIRQDQVIKLMQEYADLYHKSKLKEELIKFAGFITDEYLKTKE